MRTVWPRLAQSFPALASREFRIFWAGQAISLIGTWMQTTVQPYLAYRLTDQPIYLGLVGFATTLPTLLFTLPAGVLVERLDKRRVVIVMQCVMLGQALTLAYLTLSGAITIWHIVALAFVLGTANSLEITSRQAMLVELVGRQALPNAIALNSTIFNAARVIGPALAAPFLLLLPVNGEGWAFFANGLSYGVVIVGLLTISRRPHLPSREARASALAEFRDGQRYIRQTPVVGMLMVMASVVGFFGIPLVQQIPVLAQDVLAAPGEPASAGAARNSFLLTAQGVGALTAAVALATVGSRVKHKGALLLAGQIAVGLAFIGLSLNRSYPVALALMALFGWGIVTHLANSNTLIQLAVPDSLRGRVISTYLWGLQGIAPIGSLLTGYVVQRWGLPVSTLIAGGICLVSTALIHLHTPAIRRTVA